MSDKNIQYQNKIEFCMSFVTHDFIDSTVSDNESHKKIPIPCFLEGLTRGAEKLADLLDDFYNYRYDSIEILQRIKNAKNSSFNLPASYLEHAQEVCSNELDIFDPMPIHTQKHCFRNINNRSEIRKILNEVLEKKKTMLDDVDTLIDYFNKCDFYKSLAKNDSPIYLFRVMRNQLYKVLATASSSSSAYITAIELYMNIFIDAMNYNFNINEYYMKEGHDINRRNSASSVLRSAVETYSLNRIFCLCPYNSCERITERQKPYVWFSRKAQAPYYDGTLQQLEAFITMFFDTHTRVVRKDESSSDSSESESQASSSDSYSDDSENNDSESESQASSPDSYSDDSASDNSESESQETEDELRYPTICKKCPRKGSKKCSRKVPHRVGSDDEHQKRQEVISEESHEEKSHDESNIDFTQFQFDDSSEHDLEERIF